MLNESRPALTGLISRMLDDPSAERYCDRASACRLGEETAMMPQLVMYEEELQQIKRSAIGSTETSNAGGARHRQERSGDRARR